MLSHAKNVNSFTVMTRQIKDSVKGGIYLLLAYGIFLALMLSLSGCSTITKHDAWVMRFTNPIALKAIVVTDHDMVVKLCSIGLDTWDNGEPIKDKENIGGCYDTDKEIIIVDIEHPGVLLHELCHAAGYPAKGCHNVGWPDENSLTKTQTRAIIYKEVKIDNGLKKVAFLP